jgi:hypothetical protein
LSTAEVDIPALSDGMLAAGFAGSAAFVVGTFEGAAVDVAAAAAAAAAGAAAAVVEQVEVSILLAYLLAYLLGQTVDGLHEHYLAYRSQWHRHQNFQEQAPFRRVFRTQGRKTPGPFAFAKVAAVH